MKKYFLLFIFLLPTCFGFAQSEQGKDHKWGIGFNINTVENWPYSEISSSGDGDFKNKSYSIGINAQYHNDEKNISYRIRMSFTKISFLSANNEASNLSNYINLEERNKQNMETIAPGFFLSTSNNKRLNFYGGFEMPVKFFGNFIIEANTKTYTNSLLSSSSISIDTYKGGIAFGLGGFTGFQMQVTKNISVGLEISSAFLFYKFDGVNTYENATYDANGNLTSTNSTTITTKTRSSGMSKLHASLNITYRF